MVVYYLGRGFNREPGALPITHKQRPIVKSLKEALGDFPFGLEADALVPINYTETWMTVYRNESGRKPCRVFSSPSVLRAENVYSTMYHKRSGQRSGISHVVEKIEGNQGDLTFFDFQPKLILHSPRSTN
jgi:hypothetical protein